MTVFGAVCDVAVPDDGIIFLASTLQAHTIREEAVYDGIRVTERFHAMVDLGLSNSRMKDFFDIWFLARQFPFDGRILATAVSTTFERRQTPVLSTPPLALTDTFAGDAGKQTQWLAFAKRARIELPAPSLFDVIANIKELMLPVTEAITSKRDFNAAWLPKGPWRPSV